MKQAERKPDLLHKKIMKMYKNYGLDVTNMSEDEVKRIKALYEDGKSNIDLDLKKSEKYSNQFLEDII